MAGRGFIRIVRYDIKEGFKQNIFKNLIGIGVLCFICLIGIIDCNLSAEENGFLGYLAYIFQGIPEYVKTPDSHFELPVIWLLFHLYILFLVSTYPFKDIHNCGKNVLIFSGSRRYWWFSKCIWTAVNIIQYYFVCYLLMSVITLLRNEYRFYVLDIINVLGNPYSELQIIDILLALCILPVMTSISIALSQMLISFVWGPAIGYLSSIVLLVCSAYLSHPLLAGNYTMLLRTRMYSESGVFWGMGLIMSVLIGGAAIYFGTRYMTQYDILERG